MKTILFSIFCILFIRSVAVLGQPYTTCSMIYQGPGAFGVTQYANNLDTSVTFFSSNSTQLKVNILNFDLGAGDTLFIYDGPNTNSLILQVLDSTYISEPTFTSSDTSITIRFKSDGSAQGTGFTLKVFCSGTSYISNISNPTITPGANFITTITFSNTDNLNFLESPRLDLLIDATYLTADTFNVLNDSTLRAVFLGIGCSVANLNPNDIKIQLFDTDYLICDGAPGLLSINKLVIDPININPPSCASYADGSADATGKVSGGTMPYSYIFARDFLIWDTIIAINLSAGNYTLFVSDSNNCTTSVDFTIDDPPPFSVSLGPDRAICSGDNITLTVEAFGGTPGSYSWVPNAYLVDNGNGTASVSPTVSTKFTVIVSSTSNCVDTSQVFITVNSLPIVNAGPDVSGCNGSIHNLLADSLGSGYSFSWVPTGNLSNPYIHNPTVTIAGNDVVYTLYVTNDFTGCVNFDVVNVVSYPLPSFSISPIESCYPTPVQGIITGDSLAIYSWSPSTYLSSTTGMVVDIGLLSTITYTVTATSYFGCTNSLTVTAISKPSPVIDSIISPNDVCVGSPLNVVANVTHNGNYLAGSKFYFGDGGQLNSTSGSYTYTSSGNFVINFEATNDFGCSAYDSVFITVNPLPNASFTGIANEYCQNDTNTYELLPVTSGGYVTIDNVPASFNISPALHLNPVGSHVVKYSITDLNSCSASDSVVVNTIAAPNASVAGFGGPYCQGDGIVYPLNPMLSGGTFSGTGSSAISGLDFVPSSLAPGNYNVVYQVIEGSCSNSETYSFTVNESPVASINVISSPNCFGQGGELMLVATGGTAPYTYSWLSGLNTANNNTPQFGSNQGFVRDANGCIGVADTVLFAPPPIEINQINLVKPNCNLANGSIEVIVGGGTPPFSYSWCVGGDVDSVLSNIPFGDYCLYITDSAGCLKDTTIQLDYVGTFPSIDGQVQVNGSPINGGAWVILYEQTSSGAYITKDSTEVDGSGNYLFNNLNVGNYIVSASPNINSYPFGVTTFMGSGSSTHRWENADVLNMQCDFTTNFPIEMINLLPTSGNSTISGTIIDVTVRDSTDTLFRYSGRFRRPGEPIRGIDIILEDRPGGNISMRVTTDTAEATAGRFEFNNVPLGNYQLYVLIPGCGMVSTYALTVNNNDYIFDRDFYVDSVAGTIDTVTTIRLPDPTGGRTVKLSQEIQAKVYPTLFNQSINLDYSSNKDNRSILITLRDLNGRQIISKQITANMGLNRWILNTEALNLSNGVYFLELRDGNGSPQHFKMIKH